MVGGSDILIQDGETNGSISASNVRHPRSAIGIDVEGFVYFVVADGRSTASVGMSLSELQRYLSQLGLIDAINLDGGGSSTLVVRESVMNTPSDGRERPVAAVVEVTSGDTSCWHQLIRC
jgi:exopolysaccharide biosynthesis protein